MVIGFRLDPAPEYRHPGIITVEVGLGGENVIYVAIIGVVRQDFRI